MKMTFLERWSHMPYKWHALFIGMFLMGLSLIISPFVWLPFLWLLSNHVKLIFLIAGPILALFSLGGYALKSYNYQPYDYLNLAIENGDLGQVKWLTDKARGDRRLIPNEETLNFAAKEGQLDIVKWLTDKVRGDRQLRFTGDIVYFLTNKIPSGRLDELRLLSEQAEEKQKPAEPSFQLIYKF